MTVPAHHRQRHSRRMRLLTRALPVAIVAVAALGVGIYELSHASGNPRAVVMAYARAWGRDDYAQMYALLSPASRHRTSELEFATELQDAAQTGTLTSLEPTRMLSIDHDVARVRFVIRTHVFGTLHDTLWVPLSSSGGGTTIRFSTSLLFPGLRPGELLSRQTTLGKRGTLLAADGTPLDADAQVQAAIGGSLGPIPASEATRFTQEGYPGNATVGLDGLQEVFQSELAGRPGGTLLAGARVLARSTPTAGADVRTTIEPALEEAVLAALGNTYSGMTVLNPKTGAILAAAGLGYSDSQPPGSTFKIITASAALTDGVAQLSTEYPVQSSVYVGGFKMQNAGGEQCGGTLLDAFAQSCDTVFAPIGVQIGAPKLVAMARRFGFNEPTGIPGAVQSTLLPADQMGDGVELGASAIGQGEDLATTLEMADVGATIADWGRRPIPTFVYGAKPRFVKVISRAVAREVEQMMVAVVTEGTGVTAYISGVQVAGKTGTAELTTTAGKQNAKKDTDAWFVGYAPAGDDHAQLVACALFPNDGYGESAAAPPVREVLEAGLDG